MFADWEYSSITPCYQQGDNRGNENEKQDQCPSLRGPIGVILRSVDTIVEGHHDALLVIETFFIALFTLTLWRSTEKLWKAAADQLEHAETEAASTEFNRKVQYDQISEQIEILRRSTEAAEGAARASSDQAQFAREEFLYTQRPKMRLKHFWLSNDNIWNEKPIIVSFWCVNTGTSNATGQQIGLRHFVVDKNERLPIDPDIPTLVQIGGIPLTPGLNWQFPNIDTKTILTRGQADDIWRGKCDLYFIGYISYFDGAGRMRITGFCRKLKVPEKDWGDIRKCRFQVEKDPDYEYED